MTDAVDAGGPGSAQKAAAVRVEELETELERVRAALADAEDVLRRRVICVEQYLEALAEEDAPAAVVDGVSRRSRRDRGGRCLVGRTHAGTLGENPARRG